MRYASFCLIVLLGSWCGRLVPDAVAQTDEASVDRPTSYQVVAELANLKRTLRDHLDNVFLYEQRSRQLLELVQSLTGTELRFEVVVERVTHSEVYVRRPEIGQTMVAIEHRDAQGRPYYGSRKYRPYFGAPSTRRFNVVASPTALHIGSQVSRQLAEQLRRGDVLLVSGQVQRTIFNIKSNFPSDSVVITTNVNVVPDSYQPAG